MNDIIRASRGDNGGKFFKGLFMVNERVVNELISPLKELI
jgi:hypothetical protein